MPGMRASSVKIPRLVALPARHSPRRRRSDVVVTMGCGDACPSYPGRRYKDWALDDPAGQDLAGARRIRDAIDWRVQALVGELLRPSTD
jgi:protein-tyrosine-phosphatase